MNTLVQNDQSTPRLPLIARRFRRWHRWIAVAIFLLSILHRLIGLGTLPAPGSTNDEVAHVWAGLSLLSGDKPKSWTQLSVPDRYTVGHLTSSYRGYVLVQPSFDHPPAFHLLSGASARLAGARPFKAQLEEPGRTATLWDVDLSRLRLLAILLYAVSFWLLWHWLRLAIGPGAALVAVVLFGFLQNLVLHQRLALTDNLVTPLFLGVMLTLERWRRGLTTGAAAGAIVAVAVAAAIATKLIALSIIAAVIAWAAATLRGRPALKPCLWAIAGGAVGVAIVLGYAAAYGFDAFVQTMRAQSGRFYDLGGLFDLIRHQPIVHAEAHSQWIVGAWLLVAVGAATAPRGGQRGVFAALIGYVAAYIFFVPVDYYGWYLMPMAPFLCAAWGYALRAAWRRPQALASQLTILLLIGAALNPVFENSPDLRPIGRYAYVGVAALLLLPWGFKLDGPRRNGIRLLIIALLAIGLSQEITQLIALQLHADVP